MSSMRAKDRDKPAARKISKEADAPGGFDVVAAWRVLAAALPTASGVVAMAVCGALYAKVIEDLREAKYFLSGITEVEREISMRTEQGLYYSYYKQIVTSKKTFSEAVLDLTRDNHTEHPSSINVLERMNVYQEVLLAGLYRGVAFFRHHFEHYFFYTWSVLALNGLMVCFLFGLSWILCGTWTGGLLTCALYHLHEEDTNRLSHAVALRETFSLPFFWLQLLAFAVLLREKNQPACLTTISTVVLFASNFFFSLFWQFNQFALLLEVLAVVALDIFGILPKKKISLFLLSVASGLLLTAGLQFGNKMLLSSVGLAASASGLVTCGLRALDISDSSHPSRNFAKVVLKSVTFVVITIAIHFGAKTLFYTTADTHIFHFVKRKLGLTQERQFDVRMYECVGAFDWVGWGVVDRLKEHGVIYMYGAVHGVWLLQLAVTSVSRLLSRPVSEDSVFHLAPEKAAITLISAVLSVLGITTLRMKYFWVPFMCLMTPAALSAIADRLGALGKALPRPFLLLLRQVLILGLFCSAAFKVHQRTAEELSNLREFWDPDTVELMQWVRNSTPASASFAGSMQLMAGVKLCTGRPVANHPHFEDAALRLRTRQLYQMYARRPPDAVHRILRRWAVSFIVLEDSICRIPSTGCRLPDIMDEANGEVPDHGKAYHPRLKPSSQPRFCEEIRYSHDQPRSAFSRYFTLVLQNPTFRVYQVL